MTGGRTSVPPEGVLWWILRAQWACGLLPLAFLTEMSRPAILAAASAFVAGAALDRAGAQRTALRRLTAPLVVLAAAAAVADFFAGSGDLLSSVSALLLGIQSIKFLLPKRARDGWQLCAFSFLEFLAAAASTTEIQFAAFAFLFLGLSAGAMWALHVEQRVEAGDEAAARVRPLFAAKLLLLSAAGGFLISVVLFAVTPRVGLGQLVRSLARRGELTGFSDTISLREVTGIKIDRRVVARIEFPALPPGVAPQGLYLRGATYARFDGTAWRRAVRNDLRTPRSGFSYLIAPGAPGAPLSEAEVTLEAMDNPALFVYGNSVLIEGNLGELLTDGAGSFSFPSGSHPAVRYRLQFLAAAPTAPRGGHSPSAVHLELPDGWDDLRELAARIASGAGSDAERAERLRRHFLSGFRYTITDPASSLREFLFDSRAGYCEHYATALGLLLRAAGIPSRVAAGYLGGEWSDVGGYLIVRQSDAHAWTEAWIDGRWATLDATPPLGEQSPFFSRTGRVGIYLDWMRQRWNKYVVNYSLKTQAEAVSGGWRAVRRARAAIRRLATPGFDVNRTERIAPPLAAALAASLLLARYLMRRRRRIEAHGAGGEAPLPGRYARLLRRLASRGYRLAPGDTMDEMVRRAAGADPESAAAAARFLALYHRDRFGADPLAPGELREAGRLAGAIARGTSRPAAR